MTQPAQRSNIEPLTGTQAADRLSITPGHVPWLISRGHLVGEKVDGRWQVNEASVDAYLAAEAGWVTYAQAAELAGVSTDAIVRAVQAGDVHSRAAGRNRPAIDRASLLAWARQRADRAAERNQQQEDVAERVAADQAPDDGHVWLSRTQAALVLGLTVNRVQQLTDADRIPATRRGRRWWYRRDHLEQAAAARAFHAR